MSNLGLTTSDLKGKVLDVGAGDAKLAKELKDKVDAKITSVDDYTNKPEQDGLITADVRDLPFEDNTFDTVISHASIPHIFSLYYDFGSPESSEIIMKNYMLKALKEIIRVLKPGSKAVMAPIGIAYNYESQKALTRSIKESLEKIKEEDDVEISFDLIREVVDPITKEEYKHYRLIIIKSNIEK